MSRVRFADSRCMEQPQTARVDGKSAVWAKTERRSFGDATAARWTSRRWFWWWWRLLRDECQRSNSPRLRMVCGVLVGSLAASSICVKRLACGKGRSR